MGTAVSWNYLSDNPVRGVKMPERTLKRPHRFLTMEQVRRLIAASEEPVRTIVLLAAMTGLRIGEILALRWGRVNLTAGTLRVEETCYHGHFGTPKTKASRRELPLPPVVVQALLSAPFAFERYVSRSVGILHVSGNTTRFKQSAQAAIASCMCTRRTCADQLAYAQAHAWDTSTRAGNTSTRGAGSTRPLAHDDHARSVHARQRERAEAGRRSA